MELSRKNFLGTWHLEFEKNFNKEILKALNINDPFNKSCLSLLCCFQGSHKELKLPQFSFV